MSERGKRGSLAADQLIMHARLLSEPRWTPLPHQVPPPGVWYGWLLLAGRGAGKTDACARYVHDHIMGPPCMPGPTPHWVGIIAPTLGDAATSCFAGPSGLRAHSPDARMVTVQGGTVIRWPNGSEAKLFGANTQEDTERLRSGGNRCLTWLEELAAWRYLDEAWDQMRFGLRTGPRPHWVASTTPKPRQLIKKLSSGGVSNVVLSRASMYDNPHLPQDIRDALEDAYAGTQIGRQELHAEVLDQDENALWTHDMLDLTRLQPGFTPPLVRKSVGVDPSGGAGEQGIVVVGKASLPRSPENRQLVTHGYVLADRTCHLSPDGWGRRAVQAAVDYEADDICVEINYGGDMAVSTIRSAADAMGVNIPIKVTRATRGKRIRAEPVSALTEQGRWHMVGTHAELEDQMCVVAGTLVSTQRGPVPIEQLQPGDWALTRDGLAPVAWAGQTGLAERLTRVQVQDRVLHLTPWHKIYDPQRDQFVPALNVQRGQFLAVSNSRANGAQSPGVGAGGYWTPASTTATEAPDSSCTEPSGRCTTARSPKGIRYITATRTRSTTSAGIWSPGHQESTMPNMSPGAGTLQMTMSPAAGSGRRSGPGSSPLSGRAGSAETPSSARPLLLGTVTGSAHVKLSTAVPVYDLMIGEGYRPEFYANGVLIHNCTWYPELDWSPDRLDAMVWPAWHQKIVRMTMRSNTTTGGMSDLNRSIG